MGRPQDARLLANAHTGENRMYLETRQAVKVALIIAVIVAAIALFVWAAQ
jgi:hypothetical protein